MSRPGRLFLALFIAAGALLVPRPPDAAAQAGGCFFSVNGADISHFSDSRRALRVAGDSPIEVAVISAKPVGRVRVRAEIGPLERNYEVVQGDRTVGADWSGTLDLSEQLDRGAGLQQLLFTTNGGCQAIAWVDLTGQNPFTTFLGLSAVLLLVVGLPLSFWSVRRAARGRHGLGPALVAGVIAGLGLAILSQEFSKTPLSNGWVVLWMSLPVAMGGFSSFALQRHYAAEHPDDDDEDDDDGFDMTDAHFAATEEPDDFDDEVATHR